MAYQTLVDPSYSMGESLPAGFEIQGVFAAFTLDNGGTESRPRNAFLLACIKT